MWHESTSSCFPCIQFLLTHPVWDVTRNNREIRKSQKNFYSHIPCGMWHPRPPQRKSWKLFLLTHPVWDVTKEYRSNNSGKEFLLTHPVWDVTIICTDNNTSIAISTHTSRVGCDWRWQFFRWSSDNFYSHIPCGMWLSFAQITILPSPFLLTHPVWDVTDDDSSSADPQTISTHTSRVGCDKCVLIAERNRVAFLLTHPVWDVTLARYLLHQFLNHISTHTSRVGCDHVFVKHA